MTNQSRSIMIQGTASTVGKSLLCTALCRIFTQDGYVVNPFKSQNMSLNSSVTPEGDEMGRAQVMQAEAARQVPSALMNPVLLKPTSDRTSQVIFKGRVYANLDAVNYYRQKAALKTEIGMIYRQLASQSEIVVIEGAGSPAEINLNRDDFVNMGMAKMADSPVILVGDIDKGGVFAALYGTIMLLEPEERQRVKGVVINKFRGSYELLKPGLEMLEQKTGLPVLGVIPYFDINLEDEDSVIEWDKFGNSQPAELDIVVIRLPHLSNFTDFNAFKLYSDVNLRFVDNPQRLGHPDLIILPGSKSTIADMQFLVDTGLADAIVRRYRQGAFIFGICGGFQMLGREIVDPQQVETASQRAEGLGLLAVATRFQAVKTTTVCEGEDCRFGVGVKGYEIHMGETYSEDRVQPFATLVQRNRQTVRIAEGAVSPDQRVWGTYIHGVFDNSRFTRQFLNEVRKCKGLEPVVSQPVDFWEYKDRQYDELARIVREHLDLKRIYAIIGEGAQW